MRFTVPISLLLVAAAACSHHPQEEQPSDAAATTAAPAATPQASATHPVVASASASASAPVQNVELHVGSVGNQMAFDVTKLTVPTGAHVHLTFKNNATMQGLAHNWVLVKPGTEAAVAFANVAKADAGYISEGPDVLAFTPLAQPGATTEVDFTAPAPGTYPYICTFPGHYLSMKGTLVVTP